jgi:hypothetical protein
MDATQQGGKNEASKAALKQRNDDMTAMANYTDAVALSCYL